MHFYYDHLGLSISSLAVPGGQDCHLVSWRSGTFWDTAELVYLHSNPTSLPLTQFMQFQPPRGSPDQRSASSKFCNQPSIILQFYPLGKNVSSSFCEFSQDSFLATWQPLPMPFRLSVSLPKAYWPLRGQMKKTDVQVL